QHRLRHVHGARARDLPERRPPGSAGGDSREATAEVQRTVVMDVFEAIETTRAVRRYGDAPVTDDEITRCIHAAVHGPSGGNIQPWQFLAVTDPAVKRTIGDVYRRP